MGSHKAELKSHKGVTFKFSLTEEQKSPDKDGREEKAKTIQRRWGNRADIFIIFKWKN